MEQAYTIVLPVVVFEHFFPIISKLFILISYFETPKMFFKKKRMFENNY